MIKNSLFEKIYRKLTLNPMDIRIVNIPVNKVAELIREFLINNRFEKVTDFSDNNNQIQIKATNTETSSFFKLWWKCCPQIIEWNIIRLSNEETKIEMSISLFKNYRRWFYKVFFILQLIIFLCCYYFFSFIDANRETLKYIPELYLIFSSGIFILLVITLMVLLLFVNRAFKVKYESLGNIFFNQLKNIDHLMNLPAESCGISREENSYRIEASFPKRLKERIYHRGYEFPESVKIFFLFFLEAIIALLIYFDSEFYFSIIFYITLLIVSAMFFLAVFMLFTKGFTQRLRFTEVSVLITIPILFIYCIPAVNTHVLTFPTLEKYKAYYQAQSQSMPEPEEFNKTKSVLAIKFMIYFVIILIALPLIIKSPNIAQKLFDEIRKFYIVTSTESLFHKAKDFSLFRARFRLTVLLIWITITLGMYCIIFSMFSVVAFTFFSVHLPYSGQIAEKFFIDLSLAIQFFLGNYSLSTVASISKFIILIYSSPLLIIIFLIFRKRIIKYIQVIKEFRLAKDTDAVYLYELCKDLSLNAEVKTPDIFIIPSKAMKIEVKYIGFPYFKNYVLMSSGCLKLYPEELIGILAHEIYHIKRHSLKWHLLKLLSDYSIFGNGFLAVLINSYQNELEADDFAVTSLREKGISLDNYIRALEMIGLYAAEQGNSALGFFSKIIKGEKPNMNFVKMLIINARLLFEIYFGDLILSYIHPTIGERISRIKKL